MGRGAGVVLLIVAAAACGGPATTENAGDAGPAHDAVVPFTIAVPEPVLDDLRARLTDARFPDELDGSGWTYGTNLTYLKELVAYWRDEFDWRRQEVLLNGFSHFLTEIDGQRLHFIHTRLC